MLRGVCILATAGLLSGCHLLYPFDLPAADDAGPSEAAPPDTAVTEAAQPDGPVPDGPIPDGPIPDGPIPDGPTPDAGPPKPLWCSTFGGAGNAYIGDMALDGAGGIYLVGYFTTGLDFGGTTAPLVNKGNADIYVAKLAQSTGKPVWASSFGGKGYELAAGVAANPAGVYFTGEFDGNLTFGAGGVISKGSRDIYLARLTSGGATDWIKRYGEAQLDRGLAVALDKAGNLYAAGEYGSSTSVGGTALPYSGTTGTDFYVAKYNASGTHEWSKGYGGPGVDKVRDIAVTPSGISVVVGSFQGKATIGAVSFTASAAINGFVLIHQPTGTPGWSVPFDASVSANGMGVALDSSGNVFVSASFQGNITLNSKLLSPIGSGMDTLLVSYKLGGGYRWVRRIGSTVGENVGRVATGPTGHLHYAGQLLGKLTADGQTASSAGNSDALAASLDNASGKVRWLRRFGGVKNETASSVAVDSSGNTYLFGHFSGGTDLGCGLTSVSALQRIFVLKLPP